MGTHRLLGARAVWDAERITLILKNEMVVPLPPITGGSFWTKGPVYFCVACQLRDTHSVWGQTWAGGWQTFINAHKVKIRLGSSESIAPLRCGGVTILLFCFKAGVHYPSTGDISYLWQITLVFFP